MDGDVASAANLASSPAHEAKDAGINEAADDLSQYILDHYPHDNTSHLAIAIIPHVAAGDYRKDIAAELQISMAALSRAVSLLRKATAAWYRELS